VVRLLQLHLLRLQNAQIQIGGRHPFRGPIDRDAGAGAGPQVDQQRTVHRVGVVPGGAGHPECDKRAGAGGLFGVAEVHADEGCEL